ncbi:hypothetical protein LTR48_001211 [Friedmanniomyces endolithicus]|uniref:Uncharacterized protein n=1 Tax=Rachicladosporium monterosium TaxID=1507873 RepID=A0ABR0LE69_9PEZI|nr:hypothetical protein LTR48_001211 [Friedmanniomyces endolithicus]KAK5147497.1 hypothetical protein LTR32_001050 [Rachicladosporium monterosium]
MCLSDTRPRHGRSSSEIPAILDPAKILIANTPATEMRPYLSSSRHAAATPVTPNIRITRQFTLYTRCCSRLWLASTTYSLIAPSSPSPGSSPGSLPSLSSSSSDEEADQINDLILEADAEEICPRCLDRLAWAVCRLPRTKVVLSGHYALSELQKRERRDVEGDLREVLGFREEPVGQEEELLGKAGKNWGGGLRRWALRERKEDRAEAEAEAEEGRGDGERQ